MIYMSTFTDWLDIELQQRNWLQSTLADRAKVSRSTLSNIYSGIREPGSDVCKRIAKALGVDEDIVFVKAGIMIDYPKKDLSIFEKRVINKIRDNLPTEEQQEGFLELAETFVKTVGKQARGCSSK